jgi:hypothetical protein
LKILKSIFRSINMPLWGSGSNHVAFTANATQGSYRLTNITVGVGFTTDDLDLGQVVVSTGTTGIPYDTRIANIGSGYIDLTNPYVAGTGTTISFDATDSYKPEKAIVGEKAFDGTDVFATRGGWVQRHYKKRIPFTANVSSGSTILSNVVVSAGATAADFQLGQLVGGIGVYGDASDKHGVYITQLIPAAGSGATGIVLSDAAGKTVSGAALNSYNYWDEVIVGIRELSGRTAEPEIQSVSFDKNAYSVNSVGTVIVSFTEAVNVAGTGSSIVVNNSGTGNTVASYAYGSGTNKLYYTFGVGGTGTLSIASQTIGGTGATIFGIDQSYGTGATFTGNTTLGSKQVTNVSATNLKAGQPIVSTGFTASTTITLVNSGTINLSTAALSTGSTVLFTVSESNARTTIYASHLIGAGLTSTGLTGQVPSYAGSGTTVNYFGGTLVNPSVS